MRSELGRCVKIRMTSLRAIRILCVAVVIGFAGRVHAVGAGEPKVLPEDVVVDIGLTRSTEAQAMRNLDEARRELRAGHFAASQVALRKAQAMGWNDLDLVSALEKESAQDALAAAQKVSVSTLFDGGVVGLLDARSRSRSRAL